MGETSVFVSHSLNALSVAPNKLKLLVGYAFLLQPYSVCMVRSVYVTEPFLSNPLAVT